MNAMDIELTDYEWAHLVALAACQEVNHGEALDSEILEKMFDHLTPGDIFKQTKLWYRLDRVFGSLRRKGLVTHPHTRAWRLSDKGRAFLGIETPAA